MIYFVRHGETEANQQGVFAGQRNDSSLTAKGALEAEAAGKYMKRKGITTDRIIASQLKRAKETADIIANCIGFDPTSIQTDGRISEYDMGILTGTPKKGIKPIEYIKAEGSEDILEFQKRVMNFIYEIKELPGNTLMVSHSGVGRVIEATRINKKLDEIYELTAYPNARVIEIKI